MYSDPSKSVWVFGESFVDKYIGTFLKRDSLMTR